MAEQKIDELKISETEANAVRISNSADRPNAFNSYQESKKSAADVKKMFDAPFELLKDKHNQAVDEIRKYNAAEAERETAETAREEAEQERETAEKARDEKIDEIYEAYESGQLKGEKGDKGDPGSLSATWIFSGNCNDYAGTNSIISIRSATNVANLPIAETGQLFTTTADNGSGAYTSTQIYITYNSEKMYIRTWIGYWGIWMPLARLDKTEHVYLGIEKDLNDYHSGEGLYGIAEKGIANAPESDVGLIDIQHYKSGRSAPKNDTVQIWHGTYSGNIYQRIYRSLTNSWSNWVRVNSTGSVFGGKKIVFLGDSIYGNNDTSTGIVSKFATKTGATCYNFAFGGTRAKTRNDGTGWAKLDGEILAAAIASGNYSEQEAAIPTLDTSMKDMFLGRIAAMKTFDWSSVDYIICDWGTNDWYGTSPEAYKAAMKNILATILTAYPNISFIKCTPAQRFIQNDAGEWVSGIDRQDSTTSATLLDFVEKDKEIGAEESIKVIDCFNIGINKYTRTYYFTEPDCTHPNEKGNELLVCHIVNSL